MIFETIVILCSLSFSNVQSKTIRATQYGPIRGQVLTSRSNSSIEYYAFTGVPYAAPPLGKLRFKEPIPPRSWNKTRCALKNRDKCMQFDVYTNSTRVILGSEDCLYLSVFVPKTAATNLKKMPVMVWLHRGNFIQLSPRISGGDYFMEKPVIIVAMQHRLNVFGFFTTLDDNAKGNLGLKDQLLALKWVQNNIKYFNGDPSKVTLFGSIAGGIGVLFHMLSPLSLFSGAISQSGSPLLDFAYQRNPLKYTRSLVEAFNIDSTADNAEIVEKLQAIDAKTLFSTAFNYSVTGNHFMSDSQPFSVIIERDSDTSFLRKSPYILLKSGKYTKVPLMMGFNSQAGERFYAYIVSGWNDINEYQSDPRLVIPRAMNIPEDSPCINTTLRNITNRYFPDRNYTNLYEWIPYLSIAQCEVPILKTVPFLRGKIPLYLYYFSYVGSRNEAYLRPRGTSYAEEINYLFYPDFPGTSPNETAADKLTRERMVTMWYNFAVKRNPTPEPDELLQNVTWPTITLKNDYLNINSTLKIQNRIPHHSEIPFWHKLYNECGFPDPDPNIIPG